MTEASEGYYHNQADDESGDQHIAPILREFLLIAAYLAHQNQAGAKRAVLAKQGDGSRGPHEDAILIRTKQASEQNEITSLYCKADSLAQEHPTGIPGHAASQLIAHQPLHKIWIYNLHRPESIAHQLVVSATTLVTKMLDNGTVSRSKAAHDSVRTITFIKLKLIFTGDSVTFWLWSLLSATFW
jgi:hypothetical protein